MHNKDWTASLRTEQNKDDLVDIVVVRILKIRYTYIVSIYLHIIANYLLCCVHMSYISSFMLLNFE